MEWCFVIKTAQEFPNFRNKAVIRTSHTWYFVDSSIATVALVCRKKLL